MVSLDEIMLTTGTDKASSGHGYSRIYAELFAPWRDKPVVMVEMGVWEGASLAAWAEYFTSPQAIIVGIDNDLARLIPVNDARVRVMQCQVDDPAQMASAAQRIGPGISIVIDDASHQVDQQRVSFNALWPQVAPGGLYVIEDLHTLFWQRANPVGASAWLHAWADEVLGLGLEPHDNTGEVEEMRFYNSMVVFRKRSGNRV